MALTRPTTLLAFALAALAGCASTASPPAAPARATGWLTPVEAIVMAAEAAPGTVAGTFALRVQGTGMDRHGSYLNSERDYRDQRNLTIAISPRAAAALAERLGAPPTTALEDKDILVMGAAVRTKIVFSANGRPTDKYYYQTHVHVTDADQVILPP